MKEEWLARFGQMEPEKVGLERCNALTERYGLTLTGAQMERLAAGRSRALRAAGRVEFGPGILPKLVLAFRDSPYLEQRCYEETLAELQDLFYQLKNQCGEGLTDDELVTAMKLLHDGPGGGDLDFLAGVPADLLCQIGRTGSLRGTEWEEELWDEEW